MGYMWFLAPKWAQAYPAFRKRVIIYFLFLAWNYSIIRGNWWPSVFSGKLPILRFRILTAVNMWKKWVFWPSLSLWRLESVETCSKCSLPYYEVTVDLFWIYLFLSAKPLSRWIMYHFDILRFWANFASCACPKHSQFTRNLDFKAMIQWKIFKFDRNFQGMFFLGLTLSR